MNLVFITIDGARQDRIINGKNFKKLIESNSFFPKVITNAPFTIAAMHAVFSGVYGFKIGDSIRLADHDMTDIATVHSDAWNRSGAGGYNGGWA